MEDWVKTIVKSLVENKNKVSINEVRGEQKSIYEITVAPEDMGKIIGKNGRIIRALTSIIQAVDYIKK